MSKSSISRRKFFTSSLLCAAGLGSLPSLSLSQPITSGSPRDASVLRLGFIGVGRQAMGLLNSMMKLPNVEVVAGADVYDMKLERFLQRVKKNAGDATNNKEVKVYTDYRELLANPDVDAVVIASPDHWHALMAIDACKAGKDIYLEKPLTFTIKEGQELVKAVRTHGIVLAVGSMQRSSANFQHAARMVQKGKLGKIKQVLVHVGTPAHPKPFDLSPQPVPEGLDWKAWLGPLPDLPYHEELNPPISINPEENEKSWGAWRWYKETGGGYMTDWGAHMFDIAQWGLGMDRNGPVEVIPESDSSPLKFNYADGAQMIVGSFDEGRQGVKFIGESGWIKVSRGVYETSREELEMAAQTDVPEYNPHHVDFVDSVLKRKDPFVTVEIGHSTCTVCTIGNIANELKRPLKWDPVAQRFPDDPEANTKLHYTYRRGYAIS